MEALEGWEGEGLALVAASLAATLVAMALLLVVVSSKMTVLSSARSKVELVVTALWRLVLRRKTIGEQREGGWG